MYTTLQFASPKNNKYAIVPTSFVTEKLFKNKIVENRYNSAISSLRDYLHKWENLHPTETELLNEIRGCLERVIRELSSNLTILKNEVNENNISSSKLRVEAWRQLNQNWSPNERKIRWFLINSVEGLSEDLIKLYNEIIGYNSLIAELLALGEFRTQNHFTRVNAERETLHSEINKRYEKLSLLSPFCSHL